MSRSITFRLPNEEAADLEALRALRGHSITGMMRELIRDAAPRASFSATRHVAEPLKNARGTNAINIAPISVPVLQRKTFNPQPKKGKK